MWLGATTFQWPPEIDLIEYWGTKTNGVGVPGVFFHPYGGPRLAAEPAVGNLSVGWHTFALDWTPTQLTWSIDGRVVLSTNQHVPQQPMFLVVDLAYSSGNLALMKSGAGCHGTLYVKSVKLWQEQTTRGPGIRRAIKTVRSSDPSSAVSPHGSGPISA